MWTRIFLLLLCLLAAGGPAMAEVIVITKGSNALVVTSNGNLFTSQVADRVVNLNGGDQPPPPPPTPDDSMRQLAARWKTLVPEYAQRDAHRLALSALHSAMVTRISSGQVETIAQLSSQTQQMIGLFLGSDLGKWTAWAQPIAERLDRVTTLEEARLSYEAIAAGLSSGEALSPELLALIQIVLDILEDRGVNPRLLAIVQLVLKILSGLPAEDGHSSSRPDPPEDSSSGGRSAGYSLGGRDLVAVRVGSIDLRPRRW